MVFFSRYIFSCSENASKVSYNMPLYWKLDIKCNLKKSFFEFLNKSKKILKNVDFLKSVFYMYRYND